jgi:tRNA pseudouridine55 synthase
MTGLLLLNKNPGLTSFESLRPIKKALKTPKVCHTGTLDSFAEGLLVVLTGRAVKLSSYFTGCDKRYRALVRFGEETETLDPEGEIIARAPVPPREAVEAALPEFTGAILQAPPAYSAIHVNGKRAYELARSGAAPEMKKRPVTIHELSLAAWNPPHAEFEVHCSSGTYIRSLARDIALAAGSRAHLRALTRTRVGNFSLDEAFSLPVGSVLPVASAADGTVLPAASPFVDDAGVIIEEMIKAALIPLEPERFARLGFACVNIDGAAARAVSHGGDLRQLAQGIPELRDIAAIAAGTAGEAADGKIFAALFGPDSFAALIEYKNNVWSYGFVNNHD